MNITAKELNEGQTEAVKLINEWVKMKGFESTFILSGAAGTGKTTVTNEVIRTCGLPLHKIAVSAPTHKAKSVISKITGRPGLTLQSLLGLRMDVEMANFNPNSPEFTPQETPKIGDYSLIVLDECSMVNKDLEEKLVEQSKIFGVKLLYLGDKNQLPPIKEKISKTFTNPNYKYHLTQIMRQNEGNEVTKLISALQSDVEKGTNNYLSLLNKNIVRLNSDATEGFIITNDVNDFRTYVEQAFGSEKFNSNSDFCRYLSWTNNSLSKWNPIIRNKIVTSTDELVAGDLLLSYKTYLNEEQESIVNSEEYIIKSVEPIYNSVNDLHCYKVVLYDCDFHELPPQIIVANKSLNKFTEICKAKQESAKENRRWRPYFTWKEKFLILKEVKEGTSRVCVKDLDYGYGITVHKSQGSTYDVVFINGKDILLNRDAEERKKLLYVAASRASKMCVMLM